MPKKTFTLIPQIYRRKPLPGSNQKNPYAARAHPTRPVIVAGGLGMALVVETPLRTAAGRHYHRAGKFQFLLSNNNRSAAIVIPVSTAVVVVPKMIWTLF